MEQTSSSVYSFLVLEFLDHQQNDFCQDKHGQHSQIDKKLLVPLKKCHVRLRKRPAHVCYRQKLSYDSTSKSVCALLKGEVVRFQTPQGYNKVGSKEKSSAGNQDCSWSNQKASQAHLDEYNPIDHQDKIKISSQTTSTHSEVTAEVTVPVEESEESSM